MKLFFLFLAYLTGFGSAVVLALGIVAYGLATRGPGPQTQVDAEPPARTAQPRMRSS